MKPQGTEETGNDRPAAPNVKPGIYQGPDGAIYHVLRDGTIYIRTQVKKREGHRVVLGKYGPWMRLKQGRRKMPANLQPLYGGHRDAVVDVRRLGQDQKGPLSQIEAAVAGHCKQAEGSRGERR